MKRNGTGRFLAGLLALIMVLVLLPVGAAQAADEGSLAVGGTDIDLSQNGSYCDGKVVFEIIDGKNVLTLNGYKLENYNGNGISADGIDLTIVGSAEIGVTGTVSSAISVYESNLTLNGDFTLRAQSVTGATLDVYGYLTVEGGALDVENTGEGRNAIYVYDRMTVNGGTVHAKTNGAKAISARDGITLNNGEVFLSGNANASEVFIGKQYPLYVGGEQVNDLNKGDIFGDGKIVFEIIDGKNVLTLNGYKLENYNSSGIYADGIDLTIVGSAEISVTASAIAVNGNLTLNGDFTLRADRQTGAALVVVGNLTVEGGALDVENTYEGNGAISIPGTMTVNGGTVHAKANGTNAIYARIILNNGEQYLLGDAYASEVFIGKQYPLYVGDEQVTDLNKGDIFGDGTAKFEIIDGRNVLTLNDYKLENYNGVGISADGIDLTIVGSAEIGVTGAASSAISVYEGNLTLNGDFTLRAQCENGMALFLFGCLTVEGGALDVENTGEGSEAIYAHGAMTVNSGTVHAKANGTNAITAYSITLNNGETYLLGDAYASEVKIGVPVEHTVTVVGGTADKTSAKAGDTVTITADDAEYGYAFLQWEMLEDVEFAKGDALTTTFTMPDHDVTVTPVYKEILISDIDDQTYTGEEITLTFGRNDLTLDGVDVALINGTDYSLTYANNVNAGTATVTVTFHDRVTKEPDVRMGTKSKTFRIHPASIAAAEIAEIVDQTYQGKELTPEPTVTWNGKVLEKDKDYTLRYFNNVNVGTNPYVTVTGKGNFDENTDVGQSFTIIPAPLTITAIDQEYTYNGYPQGEGGTVYATPAEIAQKVTVEGLQGDDKLTSVILDGDATEPKTYPGRIQPSNAVIGNATGTVTGNYEITYVPGTLTIKPCNYTITFVNEDGTELQSGEVLLGKTPAYTGEEPEKPATVTQSYAFAGWKDENGTEYGLTDDLPAVTGDMTYTAIYTQREIVYGEPEWTWTGYESAEATFTGTDGETLYTQLLPADEIFHMTTVEPDCENPGIVTYTASVTFLGKTYYNDKNKEIAPRGHEWVFDEFVWQKNAQSVYYALAQFHCARVESHTLTVTPVGCMATDPATCTEDGCEHYAAFLNEFESPDGQYHEDKLDIVIPAHGHQWSAPDYERIETETGYDVYAIVRCYYDYSHRIEETVHATYEVLTPPTLYEEGLGRYTADFEDEHLWDIQWEVMIPKLALGLYGEDVNALDVAEYTEDGTLYRYDVKFNNVDETLLFAGAQMYIAYDADALTLVRADVNLPGSVNFVYDSGLFSLAWAVDGEGVAIENGATVVSLYFAVNGEVHEGDVFRFPFTEGPNGILSGVSYLQDGNVVEADSFFTTDGSIVFTAPDAPTIAGEDVLSGDIYVKEDGKLLYRYDVRVQDLPEAGLWINSAQIFLTFDHSVLGVARTDGVFDWNVTESGDTLLAAWASDAGVLLQSGDVVLTLYFEKIGEVPAGNRVEIAFTANPLGDESDLSTVFDGAVMALGANTVDGSITFEDILYGDANCDGTVTAADAALILRAIVGLSELSPRGVLNADVDGDLEVTAADAAAILRFVVGLIEALPIEP